MGRKEDPLPDGTGGTMKTEKKIAVMIPCYNEAQTIGKVVRDFRAALPEAEIYVYDNNSSDGTDRIAEEAGASVRYEHRQGKGNVIRSMFRQLEADCYIMVDGDDTYEAGDAAEMAKRVLEGHYDMVVGDRLSSTYFEENKRPFHNSGNIIVRTLVNWMFKGDVTDIMSGYRAFSRLFVKSFPVLSQGFEIETEMTIHALDKKLGITSVPVGYRDRPEGSTSKLATVTDGMKVIRTIFSLFKNYRPLQFFGTISAVLFLIALLLVIPVFIEYGQTGLVPRFPTLIASGFIAVFALMSLTCGLILDTEAKKSLQYFELYMNLMETGHGRPRAPEGTSDRIRQE